MCTSKEETLRLRRDLCKLIEYTIAQAESTADDSAMPEPHRLQEVFGVGYTPAERTRTMYRDYHKLVLDLFATVGGNPTKARELFEYASRKLSAGASATIEDRRLAQVNQAVVSSLAAWFTRARAEAGNGRRTTKLAQAMQTIFRALALAPELGAVSFASVSRACSLGKHGVEHLKAQLKPSQSFVNEGDVAALFDDRCQRRKDAIPLAQIEWLVNDCWNSNDFTRESEKKKDEVFDPHKRGKNRIEHHRKRWLEVPLCGLEGFYASVQTKGKVDWGPDFHMSNAFILQHRPFWVKDPTRDVCLCRFHLEFDLLATGFTKLRRAVSCDCSVCKACPPLSTGRQLRKALTCPRAEGAEFDQPACVNGKCESCKECKLLVTLMCPSAQAQAASKVLPWERYEKRCTGQDAATAEDTFKHDFYQVSGNGNMLLDELKATMKTFNPHNDLAAWQGKEWQCIKANFSRGSYVSVQDFAENIHHIVRFEPQSKYWSQVHRLSPQTDLP